MIVLLFCRTAKTIRSHFKQLPVSESVVTRGGGYYSGVAYCFAVVELLRL